MQFAKVWNKSVVLRNTLYSRKLHSNLSNYGKTTLIYPPKPNLVTKSSFSSDNEAMNIFDRKAKTLQRDRSATFPESVEYDYLKDEIAKRLADRLEDILTHKFPNVLDLGSGTGLLAKYLQDERIGMQTLYQLELSEKQLFRDSHLDSTLERVKPIRIQGDEEFLPFANGSMDLVVSNMSLHWVNDLPGTFAQVKKVLKPDGLFLGAMLGEGSLRELRDSFTLAEQERDGGLSPHVSPFAAVADVGNLLTRAKFALPTVDTESVTIRFADPFVLMRDLQGMAESNAVIKRRKNMSKDTIMAAASVYQKLYGFEDGSVPATFQIVYFIAWTPHESQPKPKQRGSASVSMKSLGQSTEKLH